MTHTCIALEFESLTVKTRAGRFVEKRRPVPDIRRVALKVFVYSIRYRFFQLECYWRVFVRLDEDCYRELRSHFLTIVTWNSYADAERVEREFWCLPVRVYDPVFGQLLAIAKQGNRAQRKRGFEPVDFGCLTAKVKVTEVFADEEQCSDAA